MVNSRSSWEWSRGDWDRSEISLLVLIFVPYKYYILSKNKIELSMVK